MFPLGVVGAICASVAFAAPTAPLLSSAALLDPGASTGHTQIQEPDGPTQYQISFGPRPYYIINNMTDSALKTKLQQCENSAYSITDWSIGHRGGGTLQFPEETVESTELCDLHTTTNILLNPGLAQKCTQPFRPANGTTPASALCCTSDITLAEYKTLCGKQDGFNASAKTPQDFQYGTPVWRTELYDTCGTLMTLDSYIDLVDSFPGYRNFTPELKTPPAAVPMPFTSANGTVYTQQQYARDMINTFITKGIDPARVWPQSFNPPDIYQWIAEYPKFGAQAIFLDEDGDDSAGFTADVSHLASLKARGVNIIAPPFGYLLAYGDAENKTVIPSSYANESKRVGLDIIAWTFERSGPLAKVRAADEYYYQRINQAIYYDGQEYEVLNILANVIGIKAIFSDWSATVTYFANCFGLTGPVGGSYYKGNISMQY
ncbi:hypothetical protein MRB53_039676 [Persea americana]|nr:hypothetical protein MRB53_039676 [Persea americana]